MRFKMKDKHFNVYHSLLKKGEKKISLPQIDDSIERYVKSIDKIINTIEQSYGKKVIINTYNIHTDSGNIIKSKKKKVNFSTIEDKVKSVDCFFKTEDEKFHMFVMSRIEKGDKSFIGSKTNYGISSCFGIATAAYIIGDALALGGMTALCSLSYGLLGYMSRNRSQIIISTDQAPSGDYTKEGKLKYVDLSKEDLINYKNMKKALTKLKL